MHLLTIAVLALATLTCSEAALAFNCSGIALPSSIVICSDPDLTRLADERQQIYDEARSRLAPEQRNALWEDQKAWVRSYATTCGVPADIPPRVPAPPSLIECFKQAAEARAAYLRSYGLPSSSSSNSAATLQTTPLEVKAPDIDEVALVQAGGLFEIPVQINDAITLNFIIDSGASDVQIPFDVFSTLVRANKISETDILGERTYVLADGSKRKGLKFLIRKLKIGNRTLQNVPGGVGPASGDLLLGQSFLSHFDSWTIDNKQHVLKLVGKAGATINQAAASASGSAQPGPMASLSTPTIPSREKTSAQTAMVCGKPIEFAIEQAGGNTGFLGVWMGNWNNAGRLCGALIVQRIDPKGVADVTYVYGPSRPGSGLLWKQQRRTGMLSDGVLSFQDDQGSTFRFYAGPPLGMAEELNATFASRSGQLTATFQKLH